MPWRAARRASSGNVAGGMHSQPLQLDGRQRYTKSMDHPRTFPSQDLIKVRRLDADDVANYRGIRLEALKNNPEAFGSSWEAEAANPESWWAQRLETNIVLGGWIDSSPLLGVVGFYVHSGTKVQHKGVLWGMYVRPDARGTGLAACLVRRVIAQARPLVEEICLTVVASNAAAYRLYSRAGFEQYGLERRALKIGDAYYDEALMALPLRRH
jgi:RimJ/RimL family protein N-acetyltransferase